MPDPTLAVFLDDDYVRITPPGDDDSEHVIDIKMFILACLTRRNSDPKFEEDVRNWFNRLNSADVKSINKTPVRQ